MKVKLAENYGFCFGVQRAIEIAENNKNATTLGPLIHNKKEIGRLKENFNVSMYESLDEVKDGDTVIIRTHGIPKKDLQMLKNKNAKVINATCPFVTTPQHIVKKLTSENFEIVFFGDENHPEVKGVRSYGSDNVYIINNYEDIKNIKFKSEKIATLSQTTRDKDKYLQVVNYLILRHKEIRVFNTICDATFENQDAARKLSNEVDIMIVIGGKNSSNTKQLLSICSENTDSYLIEDETDLNPNWFIKKTFCGVTAGASTPDWIIQKVIRAIEDI